MLRTSTLAAQKQQQGRIFNRVGPELEDTWKIPAFIDYFIWWFPEIGALPPVINPNHPLRWCFYCFSLINEPFWGIPIYGKPHTLP